MQCVQCKFGETIEGTTSLTYTREDSKLQVLVSGIPADVCLHCGEAYLSDEIAQEISEIVDGILKFGKTIKGGTLPIPQVEIRFKSEKPGISAQEIQRQQIKKRHDFMVLDRDDFPVIVGIVAGASKFTKERRLHCFRQAQGWAMYVLVVSPFQMELRDSCTEESIAMFDTATALEPYNEGWHQPLEKVSCDRLEGLYPASGKIALFFSAQIEYNLKELLLWI